MPYIKDKEHRKMLDRMIEDYHELLVLPGYVNYVLHKIAKKSCHRYVQYRNFIGELETAKLEIYRRLTVPREDKAKEENGDVE